MRSRSVWSLSGASLAGLAVGAAAGAAAALLAAPMRGADMRATLRSRADGALERATMLLEEGRRAFGMRGDALTSGAMAATTPTQAPLSATLGEIAQMHDAASLGDFEARS